MNTLVMLIALLAWGFDLDDLARLSGGIKRISSYDRKEGDHDYFLLPRGQSLVLADIQGAGTIRRFYIKVETDDPAHLRTMLLQFTWDDAEHPSVECPLGDFFFQGHGMYQPVDSALVITGNKRGLTSLIPMPFHKRALLVLQNEGSGLENRITFQIDYLPGEPGEEVGLLHAAYNQSMVFPGGGNHIVLHAEGKGKLVAIGLSLVLGEDGWFGQGDERIYVDGSKVPYAQGTGLDGLFGSAFRFEEGFQSLYFGTPVMTDLVQGGRFVGYRLFVRDPITFEKSIEVVFEHVGQRFSQGREIGDSLSRRDQYATVAFWYQDKPTRPFAALPSVLERIQGDALFVVEGEQLPPAGETEKRLEYVFQHGEVVARYQPEGLGDTAFFRVNLSRSVRYEVSGYFTLSSRQGTFRVKAGKNPLTDSVDFYKGEGGQGRYRVQRSDEIFLGEFDHRGGWIELSFETLKQNERSEGDLLGIDALFFRPLED